MSSTTAAVSGSYTAGAQIPITRTFVQDSGTTTIVLVGQILDNGQTNWVGYDEGTAEYILPSSTAGAEQTTLADGMTYYVTEGSAPAGYLATSGGAASTGASSSAVSSTTRSSTTSRTTSTVASSTSTHSTTSGMSSASATASSSTGHALSAGAVFGLMVGVLGVVPMVVLM